MTHSILLFVLVASLAEPQDEKTQQVQKNQKVSVKAASARSKTNPVSAALPWTTWGGPNRDFHVASATLPSSFPAEGPKKLWSHALGEDGYSGVAVENGVLYTTFHRGNQEVVTALDAKTGQTVWELPYDVSFKNAGAPGVGPGPYAMPQVIGGRVYTTGGTGIFDAIDKRTGKLVWSHDLYGEFGATHMDFGYSTHPLLYKNSLIVTMGGSSAAIAAFDPESGRVLWKKSSFKNAHTSPLLINVDGQNQVVALTADQIIGFDPENGNELWRHPHQTGYGLACSTPAYSDHVLMVSSAYGTGSRAVELHQANGKTTVKELWADPHIQSHFGALIKDERVPNTVYLSSGGNSGPVFLMGVDMRTGEILWRNRDFSKAQMLAVGDKMILLDEEGNLGLITASRTGVQILARAPVLTKVSWTQPTLSGSTLYVRDRKQIMALDLGK